MVEPAQKILVGKYSDWDKVSDRLSRYEHIGKYYNFKALQDCSEKSPYYCHYLAWRLGTWKDESWVIFFNELLNHGSLLPNWDKKIKKEDPSERYEYEKFFHFLWELQAAKFFSEIKDVSVEWTTSGPDLKITKNGMTFYIDCYVYTKSFALELFIQELFKQIHPNIKVQHTPCIIFNLPKNKDVDNFLDEVFRPYLEPYFVESIVKETEKAYPVLLPTPQGIDNFYIYMDGNNPDKYIPGPNKSGRAEEYLPVCFKEAINAKKDSNKLSNTSDTKILAVNFILSEDFQSGANEQDQLNELGISKPIPFSNFSNTIDGIFFSTCGIHNIPSRQNSYLKIKDGIDHPILSLDPIFNSLSDKGNRFLCN